MADGWVRELRRRPPDILFFGASVSHEVKCFSQGPPAHLGANLREQFQRGVGGDAVDLGEVDAAGQLIQRTPDLKPGFMVARLLGQPRRWQRSRRGGDRSSGPLPLDVPPKPWHKRQDGLGVSEPEAVTRVRRFSPGPHPQSVQTTRSLVRATAKRPWTLPDPWTRGRAHRSLQNRADAVSHKRPPPSSFS